LKFKHYAPAVLWGAFLLWLGGRSDVPAIDTELPVDKAAHFVLFGILGWLAGHGWVRARVPAWYWPFLLVLAVGVVDEVHQRSVPRRSSDVRDWVADVAGAGAGFALRLRRAGLLGRSTG
jgi:VanZ family protein